MAKPSSWNEDVLKGVEACSRVINGTMTAGLSALPISATATDINWIILFNLGTATVYLGGSGVTTSNGLPMRPNGESPVIRVTGLDVIYVISGSASQDIRYLAGVKS